MRKLREERGGVIAGGGVVKEGFMEEATRVPS